MRDRDRHRQERERAPGGKVAESGPTPSSSSCSSSRVAGERVPGVARRAGRSRWGDVEVPVVPQVTSPKVLLNVALGMMSADASAAAGKAAERVARAAEMAARTAEVAARQARAAERAAAEASEVKRCVCVCVCLHAFRACVI